MIKKQYGFFFDENGYKNIDDSEECFDVVHMITRPYVSHLNNLIMIQK